jgi:acetyl esterase/lipase
LTTKFRTTHRTRLWQRLRVPIGYLITSGGMAVVAVLAVTGYRPRTSRPFRFSHLFGLWLNWPVLTFVLLAASTALAIIQSGLSVGVWIGVALSAIASGALAVLRREAQKTSPTLERALGVDLAPPPSLARLLLAPIAARGVERIANVRYGPARRANRLDVYRDRSDRSGRPVLIHFHPLFGSKRFGARYMFHRLAADGWICISANYGRGAGGLADAMAVIAWAREHAAEHGGDARTIFVAGSSLGGGLAARAAFAQSEPVAGVVCLYAYYGGASPTANAPPFLIVHGDRDSLVVVDDARTFVEQLRATSTNLVVYAELPGAQHGFDLFRSRRFDTVVEAIEAFAVAVDPVAAPEVEL